mmetsp:Transcript_77098/g.214397  ORF Transcript_77098/g.214397 Transcript_77098/m.214397 type:complete len:306 (-) Transcript_77098:77-994(-)
MKLVAAAVALMAGAKALVSSKPEPRHGTAFLAAKLRPEVVARTFIGVEDEWKAQATIFAECSNATSLDKALSVDCHQAPSAFGKSCDTVVQAVLQGSSGDRDAVQEYLDDVCGQMVLQGWHEDRCRAFEAAIEGMMTQDNFENRVHLNVGSLCSGLWSQLLVEEQEHVKKERAEEEARAKVRAEEEAKAEAEAKARADEEARAKEEARAEEGKAAEEAAARADEEAKAKAAEEANAAVETKGFEDEARGKAGEKKGQQAETDQVNATIEAGANASEVATAADKTGAEAKVSGDAHGNTTASVPRK